MLKLIFYEVQTNFNSDHKLVNLINYSFYKLILDINTSINVKGAFRL